MFGAFQRAVASAADFEEAVNAAAAVMGEDPRRLGLQAQMHSATSLLSPLEALRELAVMLDALDEPIETAMIAGLASDESHLEEVKQHTHDQVIDMLGPARRSGVKWLLYGPGPKAVEKIQWFLDNDLLPEGWLTDEATNFIATWADTLYFVVAMADGNPHLVRRSQ